MKGLQTFKILQAESKLRKWQQDDFHRNMYGAEARAKSLKLWAMENSFLTAYVDWTKNQEIASICLLGFQNLSRPAAPVCLLTSTGLSTEVLLGAHPHSTQSWSLYRVLLGPYPCSTQSEASTGFALAHTLIAHSSGHLQGLSLAHTLIAHSLEPLRMNMPVLYVHLCCPVFLQLDRD